MKINDDNVVAVRQGHTNDNVCGMYSPQRFCSFTRDGK